ncbi:sulfurtransferase TusA family protein [Celeribacter sp.]|uniref:sulfurtransferase TusA family protein n=1 Tax=Celeribacter sp. TaxID=1890673 RepID=UPI003A8E7D9A
MDSVTHDIDAIGLLCPLPVLRARKVLAGAKKGTVVRLRATDPAAVIDVPHFCSEAGHEFIGMETVDEVQHYLIRCGTGDTSRG